MNMYISHRLRQYNKQLSLFEMFAFGIALMSTSDNCHLNIFLQKVVFSKVTIFVGGAIATISKLLYIQHTVKILISYFVYAATYKQFKYLCLCCLKNGNRRPLPYIIMMACKYWTWKLTLAALKRMDVSLFHPFIRKLCIASWEYAPNFTIWKALGCCRLATIPLHVGSVFWNFISYSKFRRIIVNVKPHL